MKKRTRPILNWHTEGFAMMDECGVYGPPVTSNRPKGKRSCRVLIMLPADFNSLCRQIKNPNPQPRNGQRKTK